MKTRFCAALCLLMLAAANSQAQVNYTWNEWFKQKKTELKYLGEHIAQLQVYLKFVKDGYKLVDKGNKLIQQAKNGELSIHDVFYLSLKLVNQRIKNYPGVRKIIDHHSYIATTSAALLKKSAGTTGLTAEDKQYVSATLSRLRTDMSGSLDELMQVLSDHQIEMTDDERIRKIDQLEQYASKRVVFIKYYYAHVMALSEQRKGEQAESAVLRHYYDIE